MIVNAFEPYDFEVAAGRLLAEGIEARRLADRSSIMNVCRDYVLR